MEFLQNLELFSRTVENRFILGLFDLLLCGVAGLVVVRGWRARIATVPARNQVFLLLALLLMGTSFALQVGAAGASLFYQLRFPNVPFDILNHALLACAWSFLAASAYVGAWRLRRAVAVALFAVPVALVVLFLMVGAFFPLPLDARLNLALDFLNLLLAAVALVFFARRPLGKERIGTVAVAFLFLAAILHLGSSLAGKEPVTGVLWNLEQLAWFASLFTLALAIGETSQNLFDKVFVRLQIAFILLAGVMILVITQTEKGEYLANVRGRSFQLAEFVSSHVDHFRKRGMPLPEIIQDEDLLRRITLGFVDLPELKAVRLADDRHVVTFEIAATGIMRPVVEERAPGKTLSSQDSDERFTIHALPLQGVPGGGVDFFGTRRYLNEHTRKRIVLMFSLFTGVVGLSTLMIGLVVRGASATIQRQAGEIEATQRQLLQASKLAAIGKLAAGVAHEVNNPATTILSRASMLVSDGDHNMSASDREDLTAIVAQAQRIARITGGLLTFSRPLEMQPRPTRMESVLETALQSVEHLLAPGRIVLEKEVQANMARVLADPDALARALENLFRNAVEAMPGGGTLRVTASPVDDAGHHVQVQVADTGLGIEGSDLGRIFDPFFTTKEVGKGTGLGLSITYGIIQEHHGTISVTSQPGAGTCFTILLPTEN